MGVTAQCESCKKPFRRNGFLTYLRVDNEFYFFLCDAECAMRFMKQLKYKECSYGHKRVSNIFEF